MLREQAPTPVPTSAAPAQAARGPLRFGRTSARPPAGRYLTCTTSGEGVLLFPIADEVVRIGSRPGAEVFIDDASVSRRHALLVRRGSRTVILDDCSLDGVLVNGRRVAEAVLRDGDRLTLGRVRLHYLEVRPSVLAA
ncbi:MAG TPA: FHA domain-containing protein [Solirubrobacteraceae bacterium]|nr:FHA domain-containing protein [Solirubrobacteraceae bacterium]